MGPEAAQPGGRRIALLIAAAEYTDPDLRRLRAPAQDAKALAEVLQDPAAGAFDETLLLIDRPRQEVEETIEDVLSERVSSDLVLLYFSCHGVKDPWGRLYFAVPGTRCNRLASTAVSSVFVNEQMERSRAGAKIALLDCCYSGAFVKGMAPKSTLVGDLASQVCGRGCFVITATNALEYAYESGELTLDRGAGSVFTKAVVEGLRSGAADRDGDGWISAEDLFAYVTSTVAGKGPQTPTSFSSGVQGKILLARAGQPQEHTDAQRREDLAALTRRLRDLEVRYSAIRDVLPSSDNRTRRLDEIIWEATAAGASADRLGELDRRTADFAAADDAARVITLGALRRRGRVRDTDVSCPSTGSAHPAPPSSSTTPW